MPDRAARNMSRRAVIGVVTLGAIGAIGARAYAGSATGRRASLQMLLTRAALGLGPKALGDAEKTRQLGAGRPYPVDEPVPGSLLKRCKVERRKVDGHDVITLTPTRRRGTWHLLYLHGGAYVGATLNAHWDIIGSLIDATGARVTLPCYPLAPEHDYRPATAMVDQVYDQMAGKGERIAVVGDSAGGNFTMALALRRRDAGLPPPQALILFSPWLDLTLRDPRARAIEKDDPMLSVDAVRICGQWWAGDADPVSPTLSPLYADLRNLPPTILFHGDHDILVVDARTFADRASNAGIGFEYREYPGAFHVFMGATFTPEAKDVWKQSALMLNRIAAVHARNPRIS